MSALAKNPRRKVNWLRQAVLPSTHGESLRMGKVALIYNLAALAGVAGLALARAIPLLLALAWGILHPAVGVMPKAIGIRQLIVSVLFTVVFIFVWGKK